MRRMLESLDLHSFRALLPLAPIARLIFTIFDFSLAVIGIVTVLIRN